VSPGAGPMPSPSRISAMNSSWPPWMRRFVDEKPDGSFSGNLLVKKPSVITMCLLLE